MQKLLQKLHAQVDDQDYFVDKRIVAQMIAKHQEMHVSCLYTQVCVSLYVHCYASLSEAQSVVVRTSISFIALASSFMAACQSTVTHSLVAVYG